MKFNENLSAFKAYDIRGKIGSEINSDFAQCVGFAVTDKFKASTVVVGYDARETSCQLAKAVANGVICAGANVLDIGLTGTEEMYWAVQTFNADLGIEITASHNPIDYNGMKIVKAEAKPLSQKEFLEIKGLVSKNNFEKKSKIGCIFDRQIDARTSYIEKIISFVDYGNLEPIKIVINSGNGAAGPAVDFLERVLEQKNIKTNFVKMHHDPDPSFPHGIPNPLIAENQIVTSKAVLKEQAAFGVAFDGDFDRCFIFDNQGRFVPSELIVSLMVKIFLQKQPGSTIVHDHRVVWSTLDIVSKLGGKAVVSKTGHNFVKQAMRREGAIYGGEMSAHHYFKDFSYCDSGMIPWLLVWQLLSVGNKELCEMISDRKEQFPSSGEINFNVLNADNCLEVIKNVFLSEALAVDFIDGISLTFDRWRFNLRKSNTEPLVRLNIETLGSEELLKEKIKELKKIILGL